MTAKVLNSRTEIDLARKELQHKGLSRLTPWPLRALRRYGLLPGVTVGDHIKSWDVLNTARFLKDNVPVDAPILDMGAYASEILCVLHGLKYGALAGVDLNPKLSQMPYAGTIRYEVADFMQTPFPAESFAA